MSSDINKKERLKLIIINGISSNHKLMGTLIHNTNFVDKEFIFNTSNDMKNKLEYYMNNYDDNLHLIGSDTISIKGISTGNDINNIIFDINKKDREL